MGPSSSATFTPHTGSRLIGSPAGDPISTTSGCDARGAGQLRSVKEKSKNHRQRKDVMDMDFIDMLVELIESDTGNLRGVEIISTAPEGLTVGEGLISG